VDQVVRKFLIRKPHRFTRGRALTGSLLNAHYTVRMRDSRGKISRYFVKVQVGGIAAFSCRCNIGTKLFKNLFAFHLDAGDE